MLRGPGPLRDAEERTVRLKSSTGAARGKKILTNSRQKGLVDGGSRDRRKEGEKVTIERRLWFNEETVIFRSERVGVV